MRPANLLIHAQSYQWKLDFDQTAYIDHFQIAYEAASLARDKIFSTSDFESLSNFIEIICDFKRAKSIYPWLRLNHQQFIVNQLLYRFPTPNRSKNLSDLEDEFLNANNGILLIGYLKEKKYISNENSWFKLHYEYLAANPEYINWTKNEVLPNFLYSNRRILEIVKKQLPNAKTEEAALTFFEKDMVRKFRSEKGDLIDLANDIAEQNSYQFNNHLSSLEKVKRGSSRHIFQIMKNNAIQYLSLDFENAQFELCDAQGRHMGVYNFSGRKTAERDMKGDHDIWVLRK